MMKFLSSLSLFFAATAALAATETAPAGPHPDWSFEEAGLIPIQSGGRIKPLDSFARETTLFVTGSRSFKGYAPMDLLLSWIASPQAWTTQAVVQISREDVKRQLGLDEKQQRFTPKELYENFPLAQYASEIEHGGGGQVQKGSDGNPTHVKLGDREKELKRILDRLGLFRAILSGEAWSVIPKSGGSNSWSNLAGSDTEGNGIRASFVSLVRSYQEGKKDDFARASVSAREAVQGLIPGFSAGQRRVLEAEGFYNRFHPFLWAWILYFTAALLWLFSLWAHMASPSVLTWVKRGAGTLMSLGILAHVSGFGLRCLIAGRPPVSNMYESVIWVSFGVVFFSCILYFVTRQTVALAVSCALATLGLIVADNAPAILDPTINPLVPVLRSNYWLTIHVLTITLGYAAFALTLGLADATLFFFLRKDPKAKSAVLTMNQLTYRAMQFGVVLLAAGTILGGVWADYSWGRFWGWDPKEVWALIALLCYLIILHARYTGWMGQFGYASWTIVAFLSVLMAWYGVNFVLGAGLHSYGFSSGGFAFIGSFIGVHLVYLGVVAYLRHRSLKSSLAST